MKTGKIISIVMLIIGITITAGYSEEYIIDTVVGTGEVGYNGDGIKAVMAALNRPRGVALDISNRIFIADTQNNRIRMVDRLGVIYTIAGNGVFGYGGDEEKAKYASFAFPMGVHVESLKSKPEKGKEFVRVYIADTRNNRIRMVNEYGIMRTVAGSGRFGYSGDKGPATKADLAWPASVTLDENGNIYIADTYNHRIRVVYNSGTIAGDANKKIIPNPKKGFIYTLVGTGKEGYGGDGQLASLANLRYPWDVFPANGELYISDTGNHIIRKVSKDGIITTIAGLPGVPGYYGDVLAPTEEKLNTPYGIWSDGKIVYIADSMNSRVRSVDIANNKISTIAGLGDFGFSGDGSPAIYAMLSHPVDVFKGPDGNLYICDLINSRIRVLIPEKKVSSKVGGK